MGPTTYTLPQGADRDAVDDAIAAAGLRLSGVLPLPGEGAQIVGVTPDRQTKATFVRHAAEYFTEVVVEGREADRVGAAIGASVR